MQGDTWRRRAIYRRRKLFRQRQKEIYKAQIERDEEKYTRREVYRHIQRWKDIYKAEIDRVEKNVRGRVTMGEEE